jgi:hypothetical protein
MHWLLRLLRFITGESRFPTIAELHDAFFKESVMFVSDTEGGKVPDGCVRFENKFVVVYYHKCRYAVTNRRTVFADHESVNSVVLKKRGGIIAGYYDNKICDLVLSGASVNLRGISQDSKRLLFEIILHLRKICAEQDIEIPESR